MSAHSGPTSQPFLVPFPDPSTSRSRTCCPSGGRQRTWDPSSSRSRTRHPSRGCASTLGLSASHSWSRTRVSDHPSGDHPFQRDPSATQSLSPSRRPSGGHASKQDPSTTCSRSRAPTSTCSSSWDMSSSVCPASVHVSSGAWLHPEIGAAAHLRLSSLGAALPCAESRLPLDDVQAVCLIRKSYHRHYPSATASRAHTRPRSCPVSVGHPSRSRSRSRARRSPSEASSQGESHEGLSRWLWQSRSPSRMPSRGGSASPGGGKCSSRSRSSQSQWAEEDLQGEQSLLDFASIVS